MNSSPPGIDPITIRNTVAIMLFVLMVYFLVPQLNRRTKQKSNYDSQSSDSIEEELDDNDEETEDIEPEEDIDENASEEAEEPTGDEIDVEVEEKYDEEDLDEQAEDEGSDKVISEEVDKEVDGPSAMKTNYGAILILLLGMLAYFLTKLELDLDTIMNTIAAILFVSAIAYFLFPQLHESRHHSPKPKHKQYDDNSPATDYMMEKIMEVYNTEGEEGDTNEESSDEEAEDEIDENASEESKEEIEEEVDEDVEEESSEDTDEESDEEIDEDASEEVEEIDEESEEEDSNEEVDEEINEELEESQTSFLDAMSNQASLPQATIYGGFEDEEKKTGFKALLSLQQLPITFSVLWLFIFIIIHNFLPDISQSISKLIPLSLFVTLPILFMVGLNGVFGILFKEPSESLEITPKEKVNYLLNILKILIGWGIGAYIFLNNF